MGQQQLSLQPSIWKVIPVPQDRKEGKSVRMLQLAGRLILSHESMRWDSLGTGYKGQAVSVPQRQSLLLWDYGGTARIYTVPPLTAKDMKSYPVSTAA